VYDNTLVCSGYLPDGTEFFASGTGIYINDLSGGNSSTFFGNGAYDNVVGWIQPPHSQQNGLDQARASDYSLPDADPALTYGNVDLSGVIDSAAESAAGSGWIAELDTYGITAGAVNLLQYFLTSQPGIPIPNSYLVGAAVQAAPVASPTPPVAPVTTTSTATAPAAPKSKPASGSKAVVRDVTNRRLKASEVATYAASVATIRNTGWTALAAGGSTATPQKINEDAKFLADR
jgi:hypothetical protein